MSVEMDTIRLIAARSLCPNEFREALRIAYLDGKVESAVEKDLVWTAQDGARRAITERFLSATRNDLYPAAVWRTTLTQSQLVSRIAALAPAASLDVLFYIAKDTARGLSITLEGVFVAVAKNGGWRCYEGGILYGESAGGA